MSRPTISPAAAEPAGQGPAETRAAVEAALIRLAPEAPLGIALSGGGDSTALTLIAAAWAARTARRLEAATLDHGLRPGSRAEAEAAGAFAGRLGLRHDLLRWNEPPRGNLQAEARAARQRLIGAWARERGLAAVLLGHSLDDQAETVLMRLARGSGADGLSGMAERVEIAGMTWLRPCLAIRRSALRALLRAEGVAWAEDPSNDDPGFDRIAARQALATLAPLGITAEGLAETAARLARQRRVLDAARAALAARAREITPWGARLEIGALAEAEEDTALAVIAETLMLVSGAPYRPRFRALARLWAAARQPGFPGATLHGCVIRSAQRPAPGAMLEISREDTDAPSPC